MSEQRNEAANIEQRYVAEHDETEALVEGLDPAQPREQKTIRPGRRRRATTSRSTSTRWPTPSGDAASDPSVTGAWRSVVALCHDPPPCGIW